ncbi:Protein FecR [Pseudomonas reidholzensis]|uniref:Protein FecR n=1 Tax=Pseudomonas reidholzensis TaxID=1785162 RepID=A0A383RY81_9PSED|nr:FecR family protein [Pseudomonas reidholzensis]SYX91574.1 Protein FecR [Pseudomonas reidholzensis]
MSTPLTELQGKVVDEAIDWSVKMTFNTPDSATQQAFEHWLAASPVHRQAWQRMQSLSGHFAGLPKAVALKTLSKLPEGRLQRRQALKLLAVLAGVGVTTWGTRQYTPWQRLVADYSTRIGEHRRWTLDDGSVLDLNTDSAISVDFAADQRLLTLLRGEVALECGADQRPLRLQTPECLLEAFATRFEVRLQDGATCLSVADGAVRVSRSASAEPLTVQQGERWRITATQALRLPPPDPQQSAWRDGMFIARDLPLGDVLKELGRYRVGYLGCDPQIAQMIISGNFSTDRPEQAVELIADSHRLQLHRLTRYWVRLAPA